MTAQEVGPRRVQSGGSAWPSIRFLLRLIVAATGVLFLVVGLTTLGARPLNGLFSAVMGLSLLLDAAVPGFIAARVPALRRIPGGASTALGLLAFLAFIGAIATTPAPAREARPTATVGAAVGGALATATVAPTPPPTPVPPRPAAADTGLAGQVRYIANTDGIGVKSRTTCDDQAGIEGWPEGVAVTVEYARPDCPEWLMVKRSDTERSWVRVAYLAEGPPAAAAAPPQSPATPAPPAPTTAPAKPATPVTRSPEELLAIMQYGASIRPNDPRIQPFAQQLDRLEAKCLEDRGKLAALAAGANKVMADRGVREQVLETARGVAIASEGQPTAGMCQDLFVAYATLRMGGAPGTSGR